METGNDNRISKPSGMTHEAKARSTDLLSWKLSHEFAWATIQTYTEPLYLSRFCNQQQYSTEPTARRGVSEESLFVARK